MKLSRAKGESCKSFYRVFKLLCAHVVILKSTAYVLHWRFICFLEYFGVLWNYFAFLHFRCPWKKWCLPTSSWVWWNCKIVCPLQLLPTKKYYRTGCHCAGNIALKRSLDLFNPVGGLLALVSLMDQTLSKESGLSWYACVYFVLDGHFRNQKPSKDFPDVALLGKHNIEQRHYGTDILPRL